MNIIDALHNKQVFSPLFRDLGTWHAWEVYLRGVFGLGLETSGAGVHVRDRSGTRE